MDIENDQTKLELTSGISEINYILVLHQLQIHQLQIHQLQIHQLPIHQLQNQQPPVTTEIYNRFLAISRFAVVIGAIILKRKQRNLQIDQKTYLIQNLNR